MHITVAWVAVIASLPAFLARPAGAQTSDWFFDANTPSQVDLPAWLPADSLRGALGYGATDEIRCLVVDLNRDGVNDYVLQFSPDVCGTNCQYEVVDGRTRRSLGLVGGSIIYVRAQLINGYPVINQYGHSSADEGYWSTLVFDGHEYMAVSTVWLRGDALERLFRELEAIPYGPPSNARS